MIASAILSLVSSKQILHIIMQYMSIWIEQDLNPFVFNRPSNNAISLKWVLQREILKLLEALSGTVKFRTGRRYVNRKSG